MTMLGALFKDCLEIIILSIHLLDILKIKHFSSKVESERYLLDNASTPFFILLALS